MCERVYRHLTSRGHDRRTIFFDEHDYRRFLTYLETAVERYLVRCHAYCLMPNHFHLLAEAVPEAFGRAMKMLIGAYARSFNSRYERTGHLFEREYHGEPVERDEHHLECFRYIVANPIRAGLCRHPAEWPWSSYRASAGLEPAPRWLTVDAVHELFAPYGGFAEFCNRTPPD